MNQIRTKIAAIFRRGTQSVNSASANSIQVMQKRWKGKKKPKIVEDNADGVDPIEHATGPEKRELLAKFAGNDDPWGMHMLKRGPGTKDQPNEIPSAFDKRIVGCICSDIDAHVSWMWVYKDEPTRCECGYWYTLVYKPPF